MAGVIAGAAIVGAGISAYGSYKAGKSAEKAAQTSVDAQTQQLEYLKEVDRLPRQYRESALQEYAKYFGFAPPTTPEQDIVAQPETEGLSWGERLKASVVPPETPEEIGPEYSADIQRQAFASLEQNPLFQTLMGGRQAGEEAILRQAGATGGLRSGNVQEALYDYNVDLRNKALLTTYQNQLQGLQNLSGLQGQTENIANVMGNIGATRAQGITAQGQAYQQGLQGISDIVGTGVGQYLYAKGRGII